MASDIDLLSSGTLVPTTENLEISELEDLEIDPKLKESLIRLYLFLNRMLLSLAEKDTAYYPFEEFITGGQVPFTNNQEENGLGRGIFRFTYEAASLGAGITSIPLGFTVGPTWRFMWMKGMATNQTTGNNYPLPYVSAAGATNIEVRLTNTTIEINNNSGQVFLGLIIVIQYLKQLPS